MKDLLRRARILALAAIGREIHVRPAVNVDVLRLGQGDCAWDVLPDRIHADSVVYSFGIGEDLSFDLALIERYGVTVHAFDPTPRALEWVGRQTLPETLVVHEVGVADYDGEATFRPPVNPAHVSHTVLPRPETESRAITVAVRRLGSLMRELGHERIDLLKMDVEGAEYAVIDDLVESTIRPTQMLVEFHHRFPGVGVEMTKTAIGRLESVGYVLFAVSEKNEEFGFVFDPD